MGPGKNVHYKEVFNIVGFTVLLFYHGGRHKPAKQFILYYIGHTSLCDKMQNVNAIVVIFGRHNKL